VKVTSGYLFSCVSTLIPVYRYMDACIAMKYVKVIHATPFINIQNNVLV